MMKKLQVEDAKDFGRWASLIKLTDKEGPMRLIIAIAFCIAAPVSAEQRNYRVTIAGFYAGVISLAANTNSTRYSVAAKVQSGGIANLFGSTSYDGKAEGRVSDGRLRPRSYEGQITSGDSSSYVSLTYSNGVPAIKAYSPALPPEAFTIDPKTQRGTLDMLSAAYWVFRDTPQSRLCNTTYYGFDGRRRTAISLEPAKLARSGTYICNGTYTRVAGFSDKALRRGQVFPVTLEYTEKDGLYSLQTLTSKTVFGTARVELVP